MEEADNSGDLCELITAWTKILDLFEVELQGPADGLEVLRVIDAGVDSVGQDKCDFPQQVCRDLLF